MVVLSAKDECPVDKAYRLCKVTAPDGMQMRSFMLQCFIGVCIVCGGSLLGVSSIALFVDVPEPHIWAFPQQPAPKAYGGMGQCTYEYQHNYTRAVNRSCLSQPDLAKLSSSFPLHLFTTV